MLGNRLFGWMIANLEICQIWIFSYDRVRLLMSMIRILPWSLHGCLLMAMLSFETWGIYGHYMSRSSLICLYQRLMSGFMTFSMFCLNLFLSQLSLIFLLCLWSLSSFSLSWLFFSSQSFGMNWLVSLWFAFSLCRALDSMRFFQYLGTSMQLMWWPWLNRNNIVDWCRLCFFLLFLNLSLLGLRLDCFDSFDMHRLNRLLSLWSGLMISCSKSSYLWQVTFWHCVGMLLGCLTECHKSE